MHILLTDVLTCPRCGPEMGLVVLADRMEGRRVMDGRLGCANCREEYPVIGGVADLRATAASRADAADPTRERAKAGGEGEEDSFRTAALLGIGEGTGTALLLAASPDRVRRVGALLPNAQVVGGSRAGRGADAGAGWVLHGPDLPFRDRSLRGVALLAEVTAGEVGEAARVLAPGARLILEVASDETRQAVAGAGLSTLLDQDGVVVASAPGPG